MKSLHLVLTWAASLSVLALVGCGNSEPGRYAVSGTVSFKGVPLKVGSIEFRPEAASSSTFAGAEITEGSYEIPASNGLVPGWYLVAISSRGGGLPPSMHGPPAKGPKEVIPEKYRTKTTLRVEVKAKGPNVFPFDLN